MSVLLITQGNDLHAEAVRGVLSRRGIFYSELELGHPADYYEISGSVIDPIISTENGSFSSTLAMTSTVIVLRFAVNDPAPVIETTSEFAAREWASLIENTLELWERLSTRPWLIGAKQLRLENRKPFLLRVASDSGAIIPATSLSTRWPGRGFAMDEWVAKAINKWQEVAPGHYFNTRHLRDTKIPTPPNGRLEGPLFLQRFVPHRNEVRLYIAGRESVAVEIVNTGPEVVDFRIIGIKQSMARRILTPREPEKIARIIMERLGIKYCVFDIAQDSQGHWVFFDINTVGSWDYLEKWYGLLLTEDIVNGALEI